MSAAFRLSAAALVAVLVSGCAEIGEHRPPPRPPPVAPAPAPPPPPVSAAPAPGQKVVKMYVPKKCVPEDLGPAPAYPDSDAALLQAGGAADRYQLMAAGRILRQQRLQKLEDAVKRCRNAGR